MDSLLVSKDVSYLLFLGRNDCAMKSYRMRDKVWSCLSFSGELELLGRLVP
jgi:hypothetical protein